MFGKMLKGLREQRRMTLRTLGQKTGLDHIVLNKIELGLRKPPPLEDIFTLADALELGLEDFEKLLDAAAEDNEGSGARFTSDELRRIKESRTASTFFTRRVGKGDS